MLLKENGLTRLRALTHYWLLKHNRFKNTHAHVNALIDQKKNGLYSHLYYILSVKKGF